MFRYIVGEFAYVAGIPESIPIRQARGVRQTHEKKPQLCATFLITGRVQISCPVAHTKSAKTHTPCNKKTGKNRDFLQKTGMSVKNHTTCTRTLPRFSKHLHPTRPKIPYKNNREFFIK